MKLAKGTLKVITLDPKALKENAERIRNRGKILVPPYRVYEWDESAEILVVHDAKSVRAKSIITKSSYGKFPYSWAPRPLNEQHSWFETTSEVELDEQQPSSEDK